MAEDGNGQSEIITLNLLVYKDKKKKLKCFLFFNLQVGVLISFLWHKVQEGYTVQKKNKKD